MAVTLSKLRLGARFWVAPGTKLLAVACPDVLGRDSLGGLPLNFQGLRVSDLGCHVRMKFLTRTSMGP